MAFSVNTSQECFKTGGRVLLTNFMEGHFSLWKAFKQRNERGLVGVFQTLVFKTCHSVLGKRSAASPVLTPAADSSTETKSLIRPAPPQHQEPGCFLPIFISRAIRITRWEPWKKEGRPRRAKRKKGRKTLKRLQTRPDLGKAQANGNEARADLGGRPGKLEA